MRLTVLVASMLSTTAAAETPALWLQERTACLGAQMDQARADRSGKLSRQEAAMVARQVIAACRATFPEEVAARERAGIEGDDRAMIVRWLRRH